MAVSGVEYLGTPNVRTLKTLYKTLSFALFLH